MNSHTLLRYKILIVGAAALPLATALTSGLPDLDIPPAPHATATVDDERTDYWEEAAQDLMSEYDLSHAVAMERLASQSARFTFRERVADALGETFGGFRFDMRSGIQHVLVTNKNTAAPVIESMAIEEGVDYQLDVVEYSYTELIHLATIAEEGGLGVDQDYVSSAQIDDNTNTVSVFVPAKFIEYVSDLPDLHPAVVIEPEQPEVTDEACTSKTACGGPLRGGVSLWRDSPGNYVCSLGFTATASDGSRWAITAGHCMSAINQTFGHGGQSIGPVRQAANNPSGSHSDVDVARIRIDNTYWLNWAAAGYLLKMSSSNLVQDEPNNVVYAIASRASVDVGDSLCLSATSPVWGDSCGTVSDEFDSRGAVVVGNYDACPGDSGGAWVWNNGSGDYWGFGVHEGGATGCPRFSGGLNSSQGYSVFSAIPDINNYWDATSAATIRIDN